MKQGIYGPNPGDGDGPERPGWLGRVVVRSAYERVIMAVDAWEEARTRHMVAHYSTERTLAAQVKAAGCFLEAVAAEEDLIAARHSLRALLPHDAHSQSPHSLAQPVVHASVPQTPTAPDPDPPAPLVASEPIDPKRLRQLADLVNAPDMAQLHGWFSRNSDTFVARWNTFGGAWGVVMRRGEHHYEAEDRYLLNALSALGVAVLQQANYHGNASERL